MLTIHPYSESGNYNEDPWVPLPNQLQAYLAKLDRYPFLERLSSLNPYGDQQFSTEESVEMLKEVKLFQKEVVERSVDEPPHRVGDSPGAPVDEVFGWGGIEKFCSSLIAVLEVGIKSNAGIMSIGD